MIKVYLFSDSRRGTFNQFFNVGDKINSKVNQDSWSKMGKGEKQIYSTITIKNNHNHNETSYYVIFKFIYINNIFQFETVCNAVLDL